MEALVIVAWLIAVLGVCAGPWGWQEYQRRTAVTSAFDPLYPVWELRGVDGSVHGYVSKRHAPNPFLRPHGKYPMTRYWKSDIHELVYEEEV